MPPATTARPVTIVVPVYGDLPSLTECVQSLMKTVDLSMHRVLLVNDNGPDADAIESALLKMTAGQPGFVYVRNRRNLGFVGNCNRAVLELDETDNDILLLNSDTRTTPGFLEELSAVLHSSPTHGAVCPRSNFATIASIPFKLRDPAVGRKEERTAVVHSALKELLPRFSIAPVAMGFCLLIRRELIRKYGLFDEAFAPGYGEENDFCLRIREHGFASVIAHRALVFHTGARSFVGARREALRSAHAKVLVSRYPFYTEAVRAYIHQERDPIDAFADTMVPGDDVVRVLIDIDQAPNNRLDDWISELLVAATEMAAPTIASFTVSAPDRAVARVARRFPDLKVIRQSRLDGQWDVALAYAQNHSSAQLARLNRTSLRWILTGSTLPAGSADFAVAAIKPPAWSPGDLVEKIVEGWGRAPVDATRLRARWSALTREPDYLSGATAPREALRIGVLRRAERIAPKFAGLVKSFARKWHK